MQHKTRSMFQWQFNGIRQMSNQIVHIPMSNVEFLSANIACVNGDQQTLFRGLVDLTGVTPSFSFDIPSCHSFTSSTQFLPSNGFSSKVDSSKKRPHSLPVPTRAPNLGVLNHSPLEVEGCKFTEISPPQTGWKMFQSQVSSCAASCSGLRWILPSVESCTLLADARLATFFGRRLPVRGWNCTSRVLRCL